MAGFAEPCPCCGRRSSRDDGKDLARWASCPNPRTTTPPPPVQFRWSVSAPVGVDVGKCGPCQICTEGSPAPPPLGFSPSSPPVTPHSPSDGSFTTEGQTTPSSETQPVAVVPSTAEPEKMVVNFLNFNSSPLVGKANAKEPVDREEAKGGALCEKEVTAKRSGGGRREKGGKKNLPEERGGEVSILVTCECGSKIEIATRHGRKQSLR